jgi:hypothetical protein
VARSALSKWGNNPHALWTRFRATHTVCDQRRKGDWYNSVVRRARVRLDRPFMSLDLSRILVAVSVFVSSLLLI